MSLPMSSTHSLRESRAIDDLKGLRRGDSDALTAILKRHERATIGYLVNLAGDLSLAQDLSQETFLRLIRKPPRHHRNGSIRPWLIGVARNLFRDHLRKQQRLVSLESNSETGTQLTSEAKRPDNAARDLLSSLTPDLREVVQLRFFAELTFREIAETLSIPLGTAQWRMNCAMKELRAKLGEHDQ